MGLIQTNGQVHNDKYNCMSQKPSINSILLANSSSALEYILIKRKYYYGRHHKILFNGQFWPFFAEMKTMALKLQF